MAKKPIRPLRTKADHEAALDEIETYSEADRFDLLALVIEDYEKKHWPIASPDPIEAIRYRMETGGFSPVDLGRLIGSRQHASDILSRKRRLTMQTAWKLHQDWSIPAEALIQPGRRVALRT
jgi:HTH-type transcriptional regulator/antitoxin HigA